MKYMWLLLHTTLNFQVSQLEGVYSIQDPHFWTLCTDVFIGMIKLEVAPDADMKYVQSQTHNIFYQVRAKIYIQLSMLSIECIIIRETGWKKT